MGWPRVATGWRFLWAVVAVLTLSRCAPPETPEPPSLTREDAALQAGLTGGDISWFKHLGNARQDDASSVAFDRDGNILMLFEYQGSVDLGGGLIGSGDPNRYGFAVAKYTSAGALLWTRAFEATPQPGDPISRVSAPALTVDRERNVLVGGLASQPINLGAGVQPPGAFLLKLRKTGQFQWARHFTGNLGPRSLVTDSQDAIAMGGNAYHTVDFGQGPITPSVDAQVAFLAKFNAAGAPQWSVMEMWNLSSGTSVAVDEEDALYLAGHWYPDPELWKVTSSGTVAWQRTLNGASGGVLDVAVHGNRVVAGGQFNTPFTFAGRTLPNPSPGNGGFLVAWTRAGEERWGQGFEQVVSAVAMGEDDSVVVGGHSTSPGPSGHKLFVARLERLLGQQHWLRRYDATQRPYFSDLAVNKQGEFVALGSFTGTVHFDADYTSRGLEDVFLFKGRTGP